MKSALTVALVFIGIANAATAEDLLRIYQDALQNDPQIREANATREATRENRPQALSALLPQIDGNAEYSRVKANQTEFLSVPDPITGVITPVTYPFNTTTRTHGYTLELRENLFSWSNWMSLRRANKEVAQAEADYQAAQQDLILRVGQRYFDVLAAENLVESQAAAFDAFSHQFEQASKRYEVGLIAVTDVKEAEAARDSAAAAVIDAKRQLATAQQALREITNQSYGTLSIPSETMPLATPAPADPDKWVELSMAQNASLISSRLAADIARADVSVARGGHLPTLDAVGSRVKTNSDIDLQGTPETFNTEATTSTIGLQVTVPIFSGGLTQSRVRQAEYRWIAAKERLTRSSRETERLARDAYLGVISETAHVNALKQALESSETALKATEAGYEVGTRTAVEVLNSRQTLVRAQTDYARSRYDYILDVIQLRLAAGNLDEKTVAEVNQWLTAPPPPAPATAAPPSGAQQGPNQTQ